jgi:glycosyltransferase involved in cell wall biosynthesis
MRKILILSKKAVHPLNDGRSVRIYETSKSLFPEDDITILSLSDKSSQNRLDERVREICLFDSVTSLLAVEAEKTWSDKESFLRVTMKEKRFWEFEKIARNDTFLSVAKILIEQSDVVVFEELETAYTVMSEDVSELLLSKDFIYSAHNVEADFMSEDWRRVYDKSFSSMEIKIASMFPTIHTCTEQDAEYFKKHTEASVVCLPNTAKQSSTISEEERQRNKKMLFGAEGVCLSFIGSSHPPNSESLSFIIEELCPSFPDITFVVVGSSGYTAKEEYKDMDIIPDNCLILGYLANGLKDFVLQSSDAMINPVFSGSGANIKVMDAIRNGIPLITTEFGIRGYDHLLSSAKVSSDDKESFKKLISSLGERYDQQ